MGGQRDPYITFRNGAYYDEWNAKEQKARKRWEYWQSTGDLWHQYNSYGEARRGERSSDTIGHAHYRPPVDHSTTRGGSRKVTYDKTYAHVRPSTVDPQQQLPPQCVPTLWTASSRRNGRSSRLGWAEVGRGLNSKEESIAHLNYNDSMTSRQASVFAGAPARWLRPENGGGRAGAGGVSKATRSRHMYSHPNLAQAMSVPHMAPVIGPLKHHRHPATDCNSTRRFAFPTVCPSHGYEPLRDWSKRPSWPIYRNGSFK